MYVSARTRDGVSPDGSVVRVTPDEDARVELTLTPGIVLHVGLDDGDGKPLRAAIRVESEAGHDHVAGASQAELEQLFTGGVSASRRRVGPLPPGRYTLSATAMDGRSAEEVVSLEGEPSEREVRLRLRN